MCAPAVPAQSQPDGQDRVIIDPVVGDVDDLSVSLRVPPPDLRIDTSFEKVFTLDGFEGDFFRSAGAIYAQFPRSDYAWTREGRLVPMIPPGTVFHIGRPEASPPPVTAPAPSDGAAPNPTIGERQDRPMLAVRLAPGTPHAPWAQPPAASPVVSSVEYQPVMSDELHRRARLRAIAQRELDRLRAP